MIKEFTLQYFWKLSGFPLKKYQWLQQDTITFWCFYRSILSTYFWKIFMRLNIWSRRSRKHIKYDWFGNRVNRRLTQFHSISLKCCVISLQSLLELPRAFPATLLKLFRNMTEKYCDNYKLLSTFHTLGVRLSIISSFIFGFLLKIFALMSG